VKNLSGSNLVNRGIVKNGVIKIALALIIITHSQTSTVARFALGYLTSRATLAGARTLAATTAQKLGTKYAQWSHDKPFSAGVATGGAVLGSWGYILGTVKSKKDIQNISACGARQALALVKADLKAQEEAKLLATGFKAGLQAAKNGA
jgi:hypothetical protein